MRLLFTFRSCCTERAGVKKQHEARQASKKAPTDGSQRDDADLFDVAMEAKDLKMMARARGAGLVQRPEFNEVVVTRLSF